MAEGLTVEVAGTYGSVDISLKVGEEHTETVACPFSTWK